MYIIDVYEKYIIVWRILIKCFVVVISLLDLFSSQVFHKMQKRTKRYLMRQLCFLFTLRKGLVIVFGNATRSKSVKMHFHCTIWLILRRDLLLFSLLTKNVNWKICILCVYVILFHIYCKLHCTTLKSRYVSEME